MTCARGVGRPPVRTQVLGVSPRHVAASLVFFFFQAEDGIRDLIVTGVQTCALPISLAVFHDHGYKAPVATLAKMVFEKEGTSMDDAAYGNWMGGTPVWIRVKVKVRSEERRVGKECRSRWSPYH